MASLDDSTVPTNTSTRSAQSTGRRSETANQLAMPATATTKLGLSALWLNRTQNISTEARNLRRNSSTPQYE